MTYSGTTRAASGAHGPLGVGGYSVLATGLHGGVNAKTLNVTAGGLAVGVTVAIAKDQRNTEAAITGGSTSTTGAVDVTADSTNTVVRLDARGDRWQRGERQRHAADRARSAVTRPRT